MTLYFKVGTLAGQHMRVVGKRKPPKVGERFKIVDPNEKFGRHEPVRLLEIRVAHGQLLFVVERF